MSQNATHGPAGARIAAKAQANIHLLSVLFLSSPRLAAIMQSLGRIFPEREMKRKSIADDVFRYVVRMPAEELGLLTIKRLAERFDVSRCHLSRAFHADRGMTLATFIKRQKLLRAERLLAAERALTVKELASRLGYSDYPYFIARFKEHWGESPGRYRKLFAAVAD
jgi:AraC-like DNA-binding protein